MSRVSRRAFLGTSAAALAAGRAMAAEPMAAPVTPAAPVVTSPSAEEYPFQPTTLFLTWRRDPTTTMTIQWIGVLGETSDTNVYFAAANAGKDEPWAAQATTFRPYPLCDLKLFRTELTELAPNTDYQFRIGKQSPTYRFRTMPAKANNPIHFVSGGDCGVNSHAIANNIQAARQDPSFALIGGDIAYDDGKSVATNLAFLRNYSKHMIARDGRLIPMVACLGNHEVEGGYNKPREKAPFFYALFDGLYPERGFATLDFGDYLSLVLLDTGHTSAIGGEQADWLEKTLRARVDHPHVFAVNHVPAYPSYRPIIGENGKAGTGEENRTHWVPLFEKYRVPVVLEHHDHTFKRSKPLLNGLLDNNGVTYLGDGSWGRLRAPQPIEKLPFMIVATRDYHLSLHRIEGDSRFHLALDEFGKVMDVCATGQRTRS